MRDPGSSRVRKLEKRSTTQGTRGQSGHCRRGVGKGWGAGTEWDRLTGGGSLEDERLSGNQPAVPDGRRPEDLPFQPVPGGCRLLVWGSPAATTLEQEVRGGAPRSRTRGPRWEELQPRGRGTVWGQQRPLPPVHWLRWPPAVPHVVTLRCQTELLQASTGPTSRPASGTGGFGRERNHQFGQQPAPKGRAGCTRRGRRGLGGQEGASCSSAPPNSGDSVTWATARGRGPPGLVPSALPESRPGCRHGVGTGHLQERLARLGLRWAGRPAGSTTGQPT